jgi:hypothetical protein
MRNFLTNDAITITPLKPSKGGNMAKAREAAFAVYDLLGADAGHGAKSSAELVLRVAKDASYGVIDESDAIAVYERYSAAAAKATGGVAKVSLAAKASAIRQVISAAKLDVGFVGTLEMARDAYAKNAEGKRKQRTLFEAFVSIARAQLKSPDKAIKEFDILACLKPFSSSKPQASRAAKVAASIEKLSADEAREVLRVLQEKANVKPGEKAKTVAAKVSGVSGDQVTKALAALGISLAK